MIDINDVREQPDAYRKEMRKRNRDTDTSLVEEVLAVDEQWREVKRALDNARRERNEASKAINETKKAGGDIKVAIANAKKISEQAAQLEKQEETLNQKRLSILSQIPNISSKNVPKGQSDTDNVETQRFGEPVTKEFDLKAHFEVAEELGMADFKSSARVAGTGFYYLEGDLALLNQALLQFAINKITEKGYRYVETPLLLRKEVIDRVAPKVDQEQMIYYLPQDDLALIGTSEHSLIGRFVDQSIPAENFPLKYSSYSMCFRKEIGSHGIDERGIFRNHQFNEVEVGVLCNPDESDAFFEEMQMITIEVFQELGIPVRILQICSGDLGSMKRDQIDVEAWSPRREEYFEVGSCSNLTDTQSRALGIRALKGDSTYFPHTLNNTVIATSRALVAILENFQNKDGTVTIPEALRAYMGGKEKLEKL